MVKQATILLTGGYGFLGEAVHKVLKNDWNVLRFHSKMKDGANGHVCDLTHPGQVEEMIAGLPSHLIIIHIAAISSAGNKEHLVAQKNVAMTENLLHYAPHGTRFVYISSADVYSRECLAGGATEYSETSPSNLYGASKLACERLVETYGRLGRISPLILRPVAIVGPNANHGLLPDLHRKLLSDERPVRLMGDYPGSAKQFLFVDDVAKLVAKMATHYGMTGTYNVSPVDEQVLSVEEVADCFSNKIGIAAQWEFTGKNFNGDNPLVRVNCQKLQETGLWNPSCNSSCDTIYHVGELMK